MNRNSAKSVYSQANILYGTTLDTTNFEDILLSGWELIGNRQTRLHKYTTNTEDRKIMIPCNCDFIEAVFSPYEDAQRSTPLHMYPDIYNQ